MTSDISVQHIILGFLTFYVLRTLTAPRKVLYKYEDYPVSDPRRQPLYLFDRGVGDGQEPVEPEGMSYGRNV